MEIRFREIMKSVRIKIIHAMSIDVADDYEPGEGEYVVDIAPALSMPSLARQAANLASSMVTFAASGFAVVDDAEKSRRLAACQDCDRFDSAQERCRECGCFASIKTWLATSSCPLGKW